MICKFLIFNKTYYFPILVNKIIGIINKQEA